MLKILLLLWVISSFSVQVGTFFDFVSVSEDNSLHWSVAQEFLSGVLEPSLILGKKKKISCLFSVVMKINKILHWEMQRFDLMTKPIKWHVCSVKTQISLGIRPVWSESWLSTLRKLGSVGTHWAHRLWSDWADAQADLSLCWAHLPFCSFCHEAAHLFFLCLYNMHPQVSTFQTCASLNTLCLQCLYYIEPCRGCIIN